MAFDTNISMAGAKAALNAVVDLLDVGSTANPRLRIYSGSQPGRPDDAATGTLLAEIDLGTAAIFPNAGTGTGAESNTATASSTVLPKTCTSATASGTASWFRAVSKAGTAIIDGSVGATTGYDLVLDNTSIAATQTVKLNSWKVKLPAE